jgi:hypothetical protein
MVSEHARGASPEAFGDCFYIESTLPLGLTLAEYRISRPRRPRGWRRLRQMVGRGA